MLTTPDKRLALHAYEQVLDLIMQGVVKPGSLIQERRLADHLQMSRTPLRDGLLMLEAEGLLVRQGARGLQVRAMHVEDFVNTLAIRRLLEPEAARIEALARSDGDRAADAMRTHLDAVRQSIVARLARV